MLWLNHHSLRNLDMPIPRNTQHNKLYRLNLESLIIKQKILSPLIMILFTKTVTTPCKSLVVKSSLFLINSKISLSNGSVNKGFIEILLKPQYCSDLRRGTVLERYRRGGCTLFRTLPALDLQNNGCIP